MVKLIVLINRTHRETPEHDDQYNAFLMQLEELPGLRRKAVSEVYAERRGRPPYTTVVEAYFDDREAMEAALTSPAGVSAGQMLLSYTPNAISLYARVMEANFGDQEETDSE